MKSLLIAATLVLIHPYSVKSEDEFNRFDWMAAFLVANEHCVGQAFNSSGLLTNMYSIGGTMKWSFDKVSSEIERLHTEHTEAYNDDPEAFCMAAELGRQQYTDAQLRAENILY